MTFQASDNKKKSFLELLNNNLNIIKLMYFKEKFWLKYFSYLNIT